MIRRGGIRTIILFCVFGAVVSTLAKVSLFAETQATEIASVTLPDAIPLEGWRVTSVQDLEDQNPEQANYWAGKEYRYATESAILTIQARYFVKTNGDVKGFISEYLPTSWPDSRTWEMQDLEKTGTVFLTSTDGEKQLSSCINPYGGSTATVREFQWNRNFQDIRYRFFPWLLGDSLKDERCLWTHMSIISQDLDTVNTDALLETTWVDWYEWWAHQLPKLE